MKRHGLTLVDAILLMVLVLFLAAFFFPVLIGRGHRTEAKPSTCQTHLRQLALAVKQYSQDYDGRFPVYNVRRIGSTLDGDLKLTHWAQALLPYAQDAQFFQCPDEGNSVGTDYYYSLRASGSNATKFDVAYAVLLCEGPDVSPCDKAVATGPVSKGEPPAFARHLEGSNYAFVDGHVKWFKFGEAPRGQVARRDGKFHW